LTGLEATHRKTASLIINVTIDGGITRIQVTPPSVSSRGRSRRPIVDVARKIVESTRSIAVAGK